jgi:hypothetical protein
MKNIIFVLTYSECDRWINHYTTEKYKKYFAEDYQLIFLDNGDQDNIKKWAKDTGSIYHRSENNIGTTGGYNWFIHVGNLLNAPRIAVMQADVLVHNPVALSYLFNKPDGSEWERDDFVYWPNFGKNKRPLPKATLYTLVFPVLKRAAPLPLARPPSWTSMEMVSWIF